MRMTPVSGDLLVKAVLVIGGAALAVWAVGRMRSAAGEAAAATWNSIANTAEQAVNWAGNAVQYVNPASTNNVIYTGLNDVFFPGRSDTIGTWLYGALNPDPLAEPAYEFVGPPYIPPYTPGSASVTPGYTGSGGAAFGIYPRAGGASGSW